MKQVSTGMPGGMTESQSVSSPSGSQSGADETQDKYKFAFLILGFLFMNTHINVHQPNVSSRHLSVIFNLPLHNIGIYFSKLYSLRVLFMVFASIFENLMYLASGNRGREVRKYFSVIIFLLMVLVRVVIILIFYISKNLAVLYYVLLTADALFLGFFQTTLFSLVPQHVGFMNLSAYVACVYVFGFQKITDIFLYNNPKTNVLVQSFISTVTTSVGFTLWIYYVFFYGEFQEQEEKLKEKRETTQVCDAESQTTQPQTQSKTILQHFASAASPFFMYGFSSLFKDFLYPGVLPFALLERDKCHLVNMLETLINIIAPLVIVLLERYDPGCKCWAWYYDLFWLFLIPEIIIFVYSLLAIHTRIPSARLIVNSQPRVLLMTLVLVNCFCFLDSLSFVGVSNYVKYRSNDEKSSVYVSTVHNLLTFFHRFSHSKLSVGYNDTRIRLGYTLPRFRPNHRMSRWNTFWFLFKGTFSVAFYDTVNDFRMNIKQYL